MTVGDITTCHTQYTWHRSMCIFLFNRTTFQVFVTYLTGKPDPWLNPTERNHMRLHLENEVARRVASDHHRSHARSIAAVNAGLKILWRVGGNVAGLVKHNTLVLQMHPHVISFYAVTSRIRFMFLLFPQVSRNWRYESEPPLKPSPLTCYKQFGTNSIIVFMFVESQRVHI